MAVGVEIVLLHFFSLFELSRRLFAPHRPSGIPRLARPRPDRRHWEERLTGRIWQCCTPRSETRLV